MPHGDLKRLQEVKGWPEFQSRTQPFTPNSYLFDARRFSHKVFAQLDAFESEHRYVVWLDADIVFKKPFTKALFKKQLNDCFCAFMGRKGNYSECGIIVFDTKHPDFEEFKTRYASYYRGAKIFLLPFWTDCHAFDVSRTGLQAYNVTPLGAGVDNVVPISPYADYMEHDKGNLKYQREG